MVLWGLGVSAKLPMWFLFGAAMIVSAFEHVEWTDSVFAALALTVVRTVPVALARRFRTRPLDRSVHRLVRRSRSGVGGFA
jgi:NhaP-type Na+/H+ or K+/H+ antiporter